MRIKIIILYINRFIIQQKYKIIIIEIDAIFQPDCIIHHFKNTNSIKYSSKISNIMPMLAIIISLFLNGNILDTLTLDSGQKNMYPGPENRTSLFFLYHLYLILALMAIILALGRYMCQLSARYFYIIGVEFVDCKAMNKGTCSLLLLLFVLLVSALLALLLLVGIGMNSFKFFISGCVLVVYYTLSQLIVNKCLTLT